MTRPQKDSYLETEKWKKNKRWNTDSSNKVRHEINPLKKFTYNYKGKSRIFIEENYYLYSSESTVTATMTVPPAMPQ